MALGAIAAAGSTGSTSGPPWLAILLSVITVLVAVLGMPGVILTAKKTRLEAQKLERELAQDETTTPKSGTLPTAIEMSPLNAKIQGYLIRFIILSLAYTFWGIFTAILNTLIFGGVSGLSVFAQSQRSFETLRYINLVYIVPQLVTIVVNVVIFLTIGWPLLKDILQDLGLRPRIFWFRDAPAAFRRVNQETRDVLHPDSDTSLSANRSGQ